MGALSNYVTTVPMLCHFKRGARRVQLSRSRGLSLGLKSRAPPIRPDTNASQADVGGKRRTPWQVEVWVHDHGECATGIMPAGACFRSGLPSLARRKWPWGM